MSDDKIFALFAVLFVAFGWVIWAIICTERTLRQRIRVLDAVFAYRRVLLAEGDLETLRRFRANFEAEWDRVSYAAHATELMYLRDPMRLYSGATLAAVEWHKCQEEPT